jgi:hypothetical protein
MAGQPRVLASFVHGTLEVIDSMDDDLGRRVRESLEAGTLAEIENAWAAGWVPVRCDVELTTAFFRLAGTRRGCEAMRRNMSETFHKPVLRSIIDGATRIFGLSPGKLLRWSPRIWPLLFKDMGDLAVEAGDGTAAVTLSGLPPEVAENREYLTGTASALAAVFDLSGVPGESCLVDHGDGQARFALSWS